MSENLIQIQPRYTSRSAVLCDKVCSYKRFITYHAEGTGLVPEYESLDLIIGTVIHRGLQHLFEHCRLHKDGETLSEACIDEAIVEAYKTWHEILSIKQIALHSGEEERLAWILAEQECLFEGLIRAFAIRRLPAILEEYIILEVEKEEVFKNFSEKVCFVCNGYKERVTESETGPVFNICKDCNGTGIIHPVIFLGKADGLFLRKSDNKIVQLSIKTASTYPEVTERNILHDMQGVSEQVCTNDRLDRLSKALDIIPLDESINSYISKNPSSELAKTSPELIDYLLKWEDEENSPKVYAVQYEFLIKGQRKQDPWMSGIYKQNNFLIHPYKMESMMTISGGQIGHSPSDYKTSFGKGKPPKGWDKIDIWEDIGIKNWVEMLALGKVQPEEGNLLDSLLITPSLILRTEEEMEEWLVSTRFREEEIARHLTDIEFWQNCPDNEDESLKLIHENKVKELIWKYFPKNTLSCHSYYGRDCFAVRHCHESIDLKMATEAGIFIPRRSHHKAELDQQIEKGLLNE